MPSRPAFTVSAILLLLPAAASAQVPITLGFGQQYNQDFNGLATTGATTNPPATSTVVPSGWAYSEGGPDANTTYGIQNGSVGFNSDTYSFGADGSTDRAFGGLGSTGGGRGVTTTIGAGFRNGSNVPLGTLYVGFYTELWRKGSGALPDRFNFAYSTNATSLTDPNATWTAATALNMISPPTYAGGNNSAVDGNLAANRVFVSGGVTGLNVPVNGTIFLRWVDFNSTAQEDGLGMDDFVVIPAPEPGSVLGVAAGVLAVGGWVRRRRAAHRAAVSA